MREIKFRALGFIREEEKWEWFYYTTDTAYAIFEDDGIIKPWRVKDAQYTGLKDKNGKEIYEGDIVTITDGTVNIIKYKDIYWGTRKYFSLFGGWDFGRCGNYPKEIEIIGNIYENPELLK